MNRKIGALLAAALMLAAAAGMGVPGFAPACVRAEAEESAAEAEKTAAEAEMEETGAEAAAETSPRARDISEHCTFNGHPGGPKHRLNDGAYNHIFETGKRNGVHSVEIQVTEGEPIGALYIQWSGDPPAAAVQIRQGEEWETVAVTEGDFSADYVRIPDCAECRLISRDGGQQQLKICELHVFTAGEPAEGIQVWRRAEGKVDMILISGHPDDELLWFGGALPYYAGERKKDVLVICCAMSVPLRRLELCDALWACGVRIHPIYLHRLDFSDTNIKTVLKKWKAEEETAAVVTEYIRHFQPDVLLLQDVNGEYGHGIHKAACWLGTTCAEQARDPEIWPESAKAYGTWDVKKIYIHLWPENQIQMDWKQPLEAFGGKTGLEAAQDALNWHKSQVVHGWAIQDGGEYDNSLFGLYSTTVGPDVLKNDFFENID